MIIVHDQSTLIGCVCACVHMRDSFIIIIKIILLVVIIEGASPYAMDIMFYELAKCTVHER